MRIPGLGETKPLDLGKRSYANFQKHDMGTYAAALSYSILFALFPFLLFVVTLISFLNLPQFFDWILEQAEAALPPEGYEVIAGVIEQVQGPQGGLLSFGAIAAIWAASGGVRSVMKALNVAYEIEESRPIWKKYLLSILYTIGLAAMLIAAAGLMLVGPDSFEWLAGQVGLSGVAVTLWTWLRFPLIVLLLIFVAAIIYWVSPNVDQPFRLISPGAVIAVIVWLIASFGFSIYVANFGNYNATYGSLGGVILLLFYFYLSCSVLLLGAEINAELHRAKLGEPQPDDTSGQDDGES